MHRAIPLISEHVDGSSSISGMNMTATKSRACRCSISWRADQSAPALEPSSRWLGRVTPKKP